MPVISLWLFVYENTTTQKLTSQTWEPHPWKHSARIILGLGSDLLLSPGEVIQGSLNNSGGLETFLWALRRELCSLCDEDCRGESEREMWRMLTQALDGCRYNNDEMLKPGHSHECRASLSVGGRSPDNADELRQLIWFSLPPFSLEHCQLFGYAGVHKCHRPGQPNRPGHARGNNGSLKGVCCPRSSGVGLQSGGYMWPDPQPGEGG